MSAEVLVAFVAVLAAVNGEGKTGPVGQINIIELGQCDPVVDEVALDVDLITYDDESKGVRFSASVPYDLKGDIELMLEVDKWEDNQWQKEAFKHSANVFDLLNNYIPKIWDNIRDMFDPKIEEKDIIPAGEYKLDDYKDMSENVELPQILYGRFKAYFRLLKDDKEITCVMAEAESFPP